MNRLIGQAVAVSSEASRAVPRPLVLFAYTQAHSERQGHRSPVNARAAGVIY